jgi:hypothetical protein
MYYEVEETNERPTSGQFTASWMHDGQPWADTLKIGVAGLTFKYDSSCDEWVPFSDTLDHMEVTYTICVPKPVAPSLEQTYCEEHGHKVGDVFKVLEDGCTINKGAVIALMEDDGSSSPLFMAKEGDTTYENKHPVTGMTVPAAYICFTFLEKVQ